MQLPICKLLPECAVTNAAINGKASPSINPNFGNGEIFMLMIEPSYNSVIIMISEC